MHSWPLPALRMWEVAWSNSVRRFLSEDSLLLSKYVLRTYSEPDMYAGPLMNRGGPSPSSQ